jgi:glycosyltransferase involved in cell wall biosynthesis
VISVVVPLYNKQSLLRRALDSIFAQTRGDFEVIVVDDGSTDESLEEAKNIKEPRLRVISQRNQGPGAARNRGAAETHGEYLAFLDADDEWLPDFLRKSLDALEQAPDCGFCMSAFLEGRERRNSHKHLEGRGYGPGKYMVTSETRPDSFDWLLYAYLPSTAVFRRGAFTACGGFYEKNRCRFGEDMYLFVAASLCYPFWRLAEPLVWYHSEDSALATQTNLLTPLLVDPQPVLDLCPEKNRFVLRGLLADRAVQESLGHAYRGNFSTWRPLFERFECLRFAGKRARNARRQILALRVIMSVTRDSAPRLARRLINRLFPLSGHRSANPVF